VVRFKPMTAAQSWAVVSRTGPRRIVPALFTSMSRAGNVGAEADRFVVFPGELELAEHVLDAGGVAVRVDVDVGAGHVEQCDHFFDAFGDDQRVDVAGRLEGEAALLGPPVVLEVVPTTPEGGGGNRAGVAVPRQHACRADPQQIDEIAVADRQQQRTEADVLGLGNP
jgi:hypothetical protein